MTNQELFDRVAVHLLRQGERSFCFDSGGCMYRGPRGLKCAIGILIPDDKYSVSLENEVATSLEVREAAGIEDGQILLAFRLQNIHDETHPEDWASDLLRLAEGRGLKPDVVLQFSKEPGQ